MLKWAAALVAAAVLAVGLWAFEPWRLFTSSEINEAPPAGNAAAEPTAAEGSETTDEPAGQPAEAADRELASGRFVDAEHDTSGTVRVLALADGRRFVRLEDLATSDGPDLHVWLTDQPSGGSWSSYDDGRYVKLGELKATHGNQNYEIPADAELEGFASVVIWCDRFNVAFGTAPVSLG